MKTWLKGGLWGAGIGLIVGILLLPSVGIGIPFISSISYSIFYIFNYPFYLPILNYFDMLGIILLIPYCILCGAIYGIVITWIVGKIRKKD